MSQFQVALEFLPEDLACGLLARRGAALGVEIFDGRKAAHAKFIAHGDIKPADILVIQAIPYSEPTNAAPAGTR